MHKLVFYLSKFRSLKTHTSHDFNHIIIKGCFSFPTNTNHIRVYTIHRTEFNIICHLIIETGMLCNNVSTRLFITIMHMNAWKNLNLYLSQARSSIISLLNNSWRRNNINSFCLIKCAIKGDTTLKHYCEEYFNWLMNWLTNYLANYLAKKRTN